MQAKVRQAMIQESVPLPRLVRRFSLGTSSAAIFRNVFSRSGDQELRTERFPNDMLTWHLERVGMESMGMPASLFVVVPHARSNRTIAKDVPLGSGAN